MKRWSALAAIVTLVAATLALLAREPAATDALAPTTAVDRTAVALDAWAQGDTVDVLWAAPLPDAAPAPSQRSAAAANPAHDRSEAGEHAHHEMPAGERAATDATSYALFHARSLDGGRSFGAATRIGADWATTPPSPGDQDGAGDAGVKVHAPHRGTDPQIAAAGDRVITVWTSPGTSKWGTGPLAVAVSNDGGRTWSRGGNPADDNSTDGHGFIDVAADPAGGFHAVWLDGRDGDTGLRVASSDDGVAWRANANVDAVTCQCCWNDLAMLGPDRLAVLYRDRDPRDMAVAVSEDGARSWERRGTAGAFGWKVEGCPHVGGGLAVFGGGEVETLHAVVWTGAPDRVGLYDIASADGGRSWGDARGLGGRGARHGDLAVAAGKLVAAWDEGAAIHVAQSTDGSTWSEPRRLTAATVRASHPLVIAAASGALVLWTESNSEDGAPTRWVAARF
jgi:hypothetical protein